LSSQSRKNSPVVSWIGYVWGNQNQKPMPDIPTIAYYAISAIQLIAILIVIKHLRERNKTIQDAFNKQKSIVDSYKGYIDTIKGYTDLFDIEVPKRYLTAKEEMLAAEWDLKRSETVKNAVNKVIAIQAHEIYKKIEPMLDEHAKRLNIETLRFSVQTIALLPDNDIETALERWFPDSKDDMKIRVSEMIDRNQNMDSAHVPS